MTIMMVCPKCRMRKFVLDETPVKCPKCDCYMNKSGITAPIPRASKGKHYRKGGLECEQLEQLKIVANRQCPICHITDVELQLDVNRRIDKVRGYICSGCKCRLTGYDNPMLVAKIAAYLANPPAAGFYKPTDQP